MTIAALADAVQGKLTAHAGLSNLVSDRIFPGRLNERPTFPCVEYSLGFEVLTKHDQATAGNAAVVECETTVYSRVSSAEARAIADQFDLAFQTVEGVISGVRYSGARLESADAPEWSPNSEGWELDMSLTVICQ